MRMGGADAAKMDGLEAHVRDFFAGHSARLVEYDLGDGTRGSVAGLRVIEVEPGPRGGACAYVTAGASLSPEQHGHGQEFVLTAPFRHAQFADLLAMTAFYHSGPQPHQLDLGHSVPIGGPWMPGATCDHFLVSLPYLHGPALEHCELPGHHARFLWLLPVTSSEIAYRRVHGTEALEQLFDDAAINPVDPQRDPVA